MDKRIEKTKKSIKNAFMELRAKKPLEKISVKELCDLAYINKSTFYSHYEDIHAFCTLLKTRKYSPEKLPLHLQGICQRLE